MLVDQTIGWVQHSSRTTYLQVVHVELQHSRLHYTSLARESEEPFEVTLELGSNHVDAKLYGAAVHREGQVTHSVEIGETLKNRARCKFYFIFSVTIHHFQVISSLPSILYLLFSIFMADLSLEGHSYCGPIFTFGR